jgi:hypothetical protein
MAKRARKEVISMPKESSTVKACAICKAEEKAIESALLIQGDGGYWLARPACEKCAQEYADLLRGREPSAIPTIVPLRDAEKEVAKWNAGKAELREALVDMSRALFLREKEF